MKSRSSSSPSAAGKGELKTVWSAAEDAAILSVVLRHVSLKSVESTEIRNIIKQKIGRERTEGSIKIHFARLKQKWEKEMAIKKERDADDPVVDEKEATVKKERDPYSLSGGEMS